MGAQKGLTDCRRTCPSTGPDGDVQCFEGVTELPRGGRVFTAMTFSLPHPLGPRRHQWRLPLPGERDSLPPQLSELPLAEDGPLPTLAQPHIPMLLWDRAGALALISGLGDAFTLG